MESASEMEGLFDFVHPLGVTLKVNSQQDIVQEPMLLRTTQGEVPIQYILG